MGSAGDVDVWQSLLFVPGRAGFGIAIVVGRGILHKRRARHSV
jgi:hypothetical protein